MDIRALLFLLLFLSACVEPRSTAATPGLQSPPRPLSPDLAAEEEIPARQHREKRLHPPPSSAAEAEEEVQTSALSLGTSYTTITEVLKHPALFDDRRVRLKGRVVDVRSFTSRTGSPSTTFALVDSTGKAVKVVTKEHTASVRAGLEVAVEGRLTLLRSAPSSPVLVKVEATRIEPTSAPGKVSVRSATGLQSEQAPPSQPGTPSPPLPTLVEDKGRIF